MSLKFPEPVNLKAIEALCNRSIKEGKQSRTYQAILTLVDEHRRSQEATEDLRLRLRAVERRLSDLERGGAE